MIDNSLICGPQAFEFARDALRRGVYGRTADGELSTVEREMAKETFQRLKKCQNTEGSIDLELTAECMLSLRSYLVDELISNVAASADSHASSREHGSISLRPTKANVMMVVASMVTSDGKSSHQSPRGIIKRVAHSLAIEGVWHALLIVLIAVAQHAIKIPKSRSLIAPLLILGIDTLAEMMAIPFETFDDDLGEVPLLVYYLSERLTFGSDFQWLGENLLLMPLFLEFARTVVSIADEQWEEARMEIAELADLVLHWFPNSRISANMIYQCRLLRERVTKSAVPSHPDHSVIAISAKASPYLRLLRSAAEFGLPFTVQEDGPMTLLVYWSSVLVSAQYPSVQGHRGKRSFYRCPCGACEWRRELIKLVGQHREASVSTTHPSTTFEVLVQWFRSAESMAIGYDAMWIEEERIVLQWQIVEYIHILHSLTDWHECSLHPSDLVAILRVCCHVFFPSEKFPSLSPIALRTNLYEDIEMVDSEASLRTMLAMLCCWMVRGLGVQDLQLNDEWMTQAEEITGIVEHILKSLLDLLLRPTTASTSDPITPSTPSLNLSPAWIPVLTSIGLILSALATGASGADTTEGSESILDRLPTTGISEPTFLSLVHAFHSIFETINDDPRVRHQNIYRQDLLLSCATALGLLSGAFCLDAYVNPSRRFAAPPPKFEAGQLRATSGFLEGPDGTRSEQAENSLPKNQKGGGNDIGQIKKSKDVGDEIIEERRAGFDRLMNRTVCVATRRQFERACNRLESAIGLTRVEKVSQTN